MCVSAGPTRMSRFQDTQTKPTFILLFPAGNQSAHSLQQRVQGLVGRWAPGSPQRRPPIQAAVLVWVSESRMMGVTVSSPWPEPGCGCGLGL